MNPIKFLFGFLGLIYQAVVLSLLFNWFVVPIFHVPSLPVLGALGILLCCKVLNGIPVESGQSIILIRDIYKETVSPSEQSKESLLINSEYGMTLVHFIFHTIMLFFGFILHSIGNFS